jgi:hypothetical protein
MTSLYQAMLSQAAFGQWLHPRDVSQFSAVEIRQAMAELVTSDRVELANALAAAGQSLYPESEDILAMSALLSEIQQDWTSAEEHLRKLFQVQGEAATPFTWRHLIRVLRCQCEPSKAIQAAQQALAHYPDDALLQEELLRLQALFADRMPMTASVQMH